MYRKIFNHCVLQQPTENKNGLLGICVGELNLFKSSGIILCMCLANERWRNIVMLCLIGWVHTQNDPWKLHTTDMTPWSDSASLHYSNVTWAA